MSRDRAHLLYIQHCIARIQHLTLDGEEAFAFDQDKQAAILYYLQTLSESTTRLSEELRLTQPQIPWQQIRGFRNRVAHDYLGVDLKLIWLIIVNELVPLGAAVNAMLVTLPPDKAE